MSPTRPTCLIDSFRRSFTVAMVSPDKLSVVSCQLLVVSSKRDVVVVELLFVAEGGLGLGLLGSGPLSGAARGHRTRGGAFVAFLVSHSSATTTSTAVAASNELETFHHDRQLAALAAALLVFPLVVLQASFDEDRLALGEILIVELRLF